MGREHPRADLYRSEREKGKTYREIAEMYGVSFQAVACACGKQKDYQFRAWTKERCIYPNLRNWLNENKISCKEFVRRMGQVPSGGSDYSFRNYLSGEAYPQKRTIDKMLEVTGLTYEQLWEVDHD